MEAPAMNSILLCAVLETAGTLITLLTLREVFRDIFHPARGGNLSDWIGRVCSTALRHTRYRSAVGPIALVAVLLSWVLLLALGFAVIYFGLYPKYFVTTSPESLALLSRVMHCLYFSFGALCTFGTFDLNPRTDWLRLIVAAEGLIGISMITASVSWLVLLYPALERQRYIARHVSLLEEAEKESGLSSITEFGAPFLQRLARELLQVRLDVWLFPISLYFYALQPEFTLAAALPKAQRFARNGLTVKDNSSVRLAATQLEISVRELGRTIAERVLHIDGETQTETVFRLLLEREQ